MSYTNPNTKAQKIPDITINYHELCLFLSDNNICVRTWGIRLCMKPLSNGSKSLYLDIYRNGKRSYEYLKMYIIPEIDDNARKQNIATMATANAIKSKRIIEMTNGEAGIKMPDGKPKMLLSEWMQQYMDNQESRGKKGLSSQSRHAEDKEAYLPAVVAGGVALDARAWREDRRRPCFRLTYPDVYKCHSQSLGKGGRHRQAFNFSHGKTLRIVFNADN